jgi:hypothetical protein
MFDSNIRVRDLNTAASTFSGLLSELEKVFRVGEAAGTGELTGFQHFISLHQVTREFYAATVPDISQFVPLYHSIWRQTIGSVAQIANLHQDGGVHHFSRRGYESRMINIWTCLSKSELMDVAADEMGLFVIDNANEENKSVYEELIRHNIHVSGRTPTRLVDNMHVAGAAIDYNFKALKLTSFPYKAGTMISFSSHLLHGSKAADNRASQRAKDGLECSRAALTSVWIHRDDFDVTMLDMSHAQYESLYMWRHEHSMWADLRTYFKSYCDAESLRIAAIARLAKFHLDHMSE